jgi:DNA-binding NtrC family response regulator
VDNLVKLDASCCRSNTASASGPVDGGIVAIDDDLFALNALHRLLTAENYDILQASNGVQGLQLITESTAVALVDLRMPDLSGIDCLRFIRENFPNVQVIILTGSAEIVDAVEAMREGAFQYVTKPFDPKQLVVYIQKGIEAWKAAVNYRDLKESHSHTIPVNVVDGKGDYHSQLMRQIERIAALDSTVFIGGESGTGKSTVARLIHQKSDRAKGPFITVNCASLPRDLIQSELFGHTRGAFTGAVKDRAGHAEVADGGTLFLDEIGDLPLELQPKLLTFLQDRTIQRLGTSEVRKVDVRLIVATHRDLATMCREGLFRQDLFYRLMVLNVELLPLRRRLQEVPGLTQGILDAVCARMELPPKLLSLAAENLLLNHDWPGNIRELENVLERAVAFSCGSEIEADDIRFSTTSTGRQIEHFQSSDTDSFAGQSVEQRAVHNLVEKQTSEVSSRPVSFVARTLQEIEREAILQTLGACHGNKAKTARILGISEKSIYNKMHRLNIDA